ncbi:protein SPMIP2 isoform X2 [Pseudorca crassidens]|uniref:protein SPMIP2 isoform X2 n=1 Tax=Pseudorca crassidens TaxID=82174 RepID=UPI00352F1559
MLTGPDYVKDHLPKVAQHTSYIGEKRPALEKTGDLRYLQRPASKRSLPAKYKPEYVGEIGWGIPVYDFINKTRLQTGFHVKYEEFSQAAVEKLSHRYQNPCLPQDCCHTAEVHVAALSSPCGFLIWMQKKNKCHPGSTSMERRPMLLKLAGLPGCPTENRPHLQQHQEFHSTFLTGDPRQSNTLHC